MVFLKIQDVIKLCQSINHDSLAYVDTRLKGVLRSMEVDMKFFSSNFLFFNFKVLKLPKKHGDEQTKSRRRARYQFEVYLAERTTRSVRIPNFGEFFSLIENELETNCVFRPVREVTKIENWTFQRFKWFYNGIFCISIQNISQNNCILLIFTKKIPARGHFWTKSPKFAKNRYFLALYGYFWPKGFT